MLNNLREVRDAARCLESYEQEGCSHEFHEQIWDGLRSRDIDPRRVSLRSLYENFVEDGAEALNLMREHRSQPGYFMEATGGAVNSSAFSNIIGQISYSTVLDALEDPEFIARDLVTTVSADTQQQEIVPGVRRIGDQAEDVGENQDYPHVGVSEEYITTPRKVKDGFILPITEEAIFEDKTGLLLQRAQEASTWLGVTLEKEILDTVLGLTTSYSRNGGAVQATYASTHTEGDFDNLVASNTLADWTDIETATLAFDDITDPNTGEPVMIGGPMQVIVPTALRATASRILSATEIREVSNTNTTTISGNPLSNSGAMGGRAYELKSSQWVKNRTGSASTWFIGNFRGAFQYREIWPVQLFRMDRNSEAGFNRDVIAQFKVRRKGAPAVIEPRKVIKCTAA